MSELAILLTRISVVLSAYTFLAYIGRWILRRDAYYKRADGGIALYNYLDEWFGHGSHGPAMVYMGMVMLGLCGAVVSFSLLSNVFYLLAAVFIVRAMLGKAFVPWWDWVHAGINAGMGFMFAQQMTLPVMISTVISFAFCVFYFYFGWQYLKAIPEDLKIEDTKRFVAVFLSNTAHVALFLAMALMTIAMAIMLLFPVHGLTMSEMNALPGSFCGTPPSISATPTPCIETMPGMQMCP